MSEVFGALATASRGWAGGTPSGGLLRATRAFLTGAADDHDLLGEAAAALPGLEPGAAAWIAVACGTVVEQGAPAEYTGPAVIDLLMSWLPEFPQFADSDERPPEPTPEQAALFTLFRFLCQSAVSHLARLPSHRRNLAQDQPLIDRLGDLQCYSHGAVWVREALLKSSGALVVLHPPSGVGLRANYSNVANCFHLFSLLQTAVGNRMPGGREPSEAVGRVARGKSTEVVSDEAWWHYGHARSMKPELTASIWGEGTTQQLPVFDGVQVLLLWPPILQSRTWDGNFLGPHLDAMPADLVVEKELTPEESRAWLARVGLDPAQRKRWWRFW
jgi:hypothetical protein